MKNKYWKENFKEYLSNILRYPLKILSIFIVKYLQYKYKSITLKNRYKQTNQILSKLKLIQHILYYFKSQFNAWGYFHPSCVWSKEDEKFFRKLFPEKDFEEFDIIVWYNPHAVTYYMNKIYNLSKGTDYNYAKEIEKQLKEWKDWN